MEQKSKAIDLRAGPVFEQTWDAQERIVVNVGGSGSGKSYALSQVMALKFLTERNKNFLITRKTNPSLKRTSMRSILSRLNEWGYLGRCKLNKTDQTLEYNGNFMVFSSMDDPEKNKSESWNYIWAEEATEFHWRDFMVGMHRGLRGDTSDGRRNQIYLSLNPDMGSWIKQRLLQDPDFLSDMREIHSTVLQNPWADADYVRSLQNLKNQDETYYKIFYLGEWAVPAELIYTTWTLGPLPEGVRVMETFCGLDFGYNSPSALVRVHRTDTTLYLEELLYRTHLTTPEIIELAKPLLRPGEPVYCDTAPDKIEELCMAGINAMAARKGDVADGITKVKEHQVIVLEDATDIWDEARIYKWTVDKAGNVLDKPVKFRDHAMDASRYAIATHIEPEGEPGEIWSIKNRLLDFGPGGY